MIELALGTFGRPGIVIMAPVTTTINPAPANGKTITAYQFSKHDIQDIEREQFDVIAKQSITVNTDDYFTYNQF